jgi:plastocyanin
MNKNLIIFVVIIIMIIGGVFLFKSPQPAPTSEQTASVSSVTTTEEKTEPSPATKESSTLVVTYTDEGFSPKEIAINKGGAVKFINNSSRGLWVGANNHPTHTLYPEHSASDCLGSSFDTCKPIANGESWEFTFDQVGSWGYHNHVRARDLGVVVVQ